MTLRKLPSLLATLLPVVALAGPPVGEKPKSLTIDKDQGGLGCEYRVQLVLDDVAQGMGVCVSEDVWLSLPESGAVMMRGKRSGLGISPRQVLRELFAP